MTVSGGTFTCQSSARGGFLYAGDGTRVKITGAVVTSNLAGKRGGAVRNREALAEAATVALS